MRLEQLLNEAVSLEIALERIKNNVSTSFIWIPVKNKKGCYFEFGGRNKDKLELKVYITPFEDGKYKSHDNGFTNSEYALTNGGQYINNTTHDITNFDNIDFVKFLNKTDFRTYKPKIKRETFVRQVYETVKTITL